MSIAETKASLLERERESKYDGNRIVFYFRQDVRFLFLRFMFLQTLPWGKCPFILG